MHTVSAMQFEHLGGYRIVAPAATRRPGFHYYSAVAEQGSDSDTATYMIKVLDVGRGGAEDSQRARFDHETKLLRVLNHPAILTVHAWGEQDGVPYLVSDQLEGVDLATLCGLTGPNPRPLSKEIAVYVVAQIVDAMRQLHELVLEEDGDEISLQAVHRDIQPENIMCTRGGDVIVYDFAAARSRWLAKGHDDMDAGALSYRAPERLLGDGVGDHRSDLFSIAMVLWELLRGQRACPGDSHAAVRDALLRFDISHPSRRISGLSPKLGEIVRKNLDRDPGRRYEDAYQMLQRLAQAPEAQAAERSRESLAELVCATMARSA